MKLTLATAGLLLAFVSVAYAQAPSPGTQNDTKQPDVFLDNHRPLNPKKDKAPTSRTLSGIVTDDGGQPLEGALVSVTEPKTNEKRTFFTKKDGRYSFDDLSFTEDYQVQAKWKKLISEPRKISQYDRAAKVVRLLQVTTPDGYSAPPAAAAEVKKEEPKK
jgi:hypothetical protein